MIIIVQHTPCTLLLITFGRLASLFHAHPVARLKHGTIMAALAVHPQLQRHRRSLFIRIIDILRHAAVLRGGGNILTFR